MCRSTGTLPPLPCWPHTHTHTHQQNHGRLHLEIALVERRLHPVPGAHPLLQPLAKREVEHVDVRNLAFEPPEACLFVWSGKPAYVSTWEKKNKKHGLGTWTIQYI